MSKKNNPPLRYYKRRLKLSDFSDTWQNILWCEIKFTNDEEYAQRLQKALLQNILPKNHSVLIGHRPTVTAVELALRHGCRRQPDVRHIWQRRLKRLYSAKHKRTPPEQLLANLEHAHWLERFLARHVLVYRGGEVVEPLSHFARQQLRLKETAIWLLQSIGLETTIRLAKEQDNLLCPQCLTHCAERNIDLPWQRDISGYGCRICGQSRRFIHTPHEIVLVLDNTPKNGPLSHSESISYAESISHSESMLRVNWFTHSTPFDFDRVEIIRATNEEVERFAMRVGNDTDAYRQPRYPKMICTVAPESHLSKNTLRILERQFGIMEQVNA